jgi:hypothetical protein
MWRRVLVRQNRASRSSGLTCWCATDSLEPARTSPGERMVSVSWVDYVFISINRSISRRPVLDGSHRLGTSGDPHGSIDLLILSSTGGGCRCIQAQPTIRATVRSSLDSDDGFTTRVFLTEGDMRHVVKVIDGQPKTGQTLPSFHSPTSSPPPPPRSLSL